MGNLKLPKCVKYDMQKCAKYDMQKYKKYSEWSACYRI